MIKPVLYWTLAVMLVFLGGALLLPAEVRFERSVTIDRPVSTVFTVLERPERLPQWLPRLAGEKTRIAFEGPRSGPGAAMQWSGKRRISGEGRLEIVHSKPFNSVAARVKVEGEGEGVIELAFHEAGAGTIVTAQVSADFVGERGFMGRMVARWFGLLFERWAAPGLEGYLARARRHIDTLPPADFAGLDVSLLKVEPVDVLTATVDENGPAEAYRRIAVFMAEQDIERSGEPMRVSYLADNGIARIDAQVPVERVQAQTAAGVRWGRSPGGWAAVAVHHGPGTTAADTRQKLDAWLAANEYRVLPLIWEQYVTDPEETAGSEQLIRLYAALAEAPGS